MEHKAELEIVLQNPPRLLNLTDIEGEKEKILEKLQTKVTDEDVDKFVKGLENPLVIWGIIRPNLRQALYQKYQISEQFKEGLENIIKNVIVVLKKLDLVSDEDVKLSGF